MANEVAQARRSAANRTPLEPNARALTAAAMRLDPTDVVLAKKVKQWRQDWQRYAWDFDETLSEIHYAHDHYGNVVSRVRLYAGFQADPDDPPVPLDDLDDADEDPPGASKGVSAAALEEIRRLDAGADGGLGALAGDFAVNLALAGEAYLHGREDEASQSGESFTVYSVDEFKAGDAGYAIHRKGATMGTDVGADDYVLRVWRRYRRFRDLADAPMRALLDDCDNLLLLKRVLYAASASRMHGGIYKAPSEWSFPQRATDPNANGQATDDPLNEQMMTAFTTPLQDPRSVGSVMPLLVRGPAETLDKGGWEDLGRGYGLEILEQIEKVRAGIAVGLDLPVEILTGMGDSNHWSAWQIAQEEFQAHIEPLVLVICRALTDGYLWPALRARGLDPTGYVVWYDASALVGHPDLFENMRAMHESLVVSDDALRRAGGASDDDAPDDDERARRLWQIQQMHVAAPNPMAAPPGEDMPPDPAATTPGPPDPDEMMGHERPALVAAGARSALEQLGPRLTQIDQDLRARVQTLADAALQRALERAGAMATRRLRGGQKGRAGSIRHPDGIRDVKLSELTQHLGREHLLSMGLDEDKLIDGELGELEPEYRKLTKRALAAALLAGRRAAPDGDLSDEQVQTLTAGQEQWVAGGFAVLSAAVLSTAHEQLFTPAAVPAGPGEIDLSARVDPGAIRESLAVAGGAPAAQDPTGAPPGGSAPPGVAVDVTPTGPPPGGVATGTIVMDAFRESLHVLPQGWSWVYGYPDRPFEPHEILEGQEFSSWTDPILANDSPDGWPAVEFYRPGDHAGCQCSFVAMFESDRPEDDNEPEEG